MFKNIFRKPSNSGGREGNKNLVSGDIEKDLARLNGLLGGDGSNSVFRWFTRELCLVYVSVLVDDNVINRDILSHLPGLLEGELTPDRLPVGEVSKAGDLNAAAAKILRGFSGLLIKGSREIYLYDTRGVPKRSIEEPPIERTTRGSRIGFIEDIETNIALVRKAINSPALEVEFFTVGEIATSRLAILYLSDVATPEIVGEVRHRLGQIKVDHVPATGVIENLMEDHPWSLFPQA